MLPSRHVRANERDMLDRPRPGKKGMIKAQTVGLLVFNADESEREAKDGVWDLVGGSTVRARGDGSARCHASESRNPSSAPS